MQRDPVPIQPETVDTKKILSFLFFFSLYAHHLAASSPNIYDILIAILAAFILPER